MLYVTCGEEFQEPLEEDLVLTFGGELIFGRDRLHHELKVVEEDAADDALEHLTVIAKGCLLNLKRQQFGIMQELLTGFFCGDDMVGLVPDFDTFPYLLTPYY